MFVSETKDAKPADVVADAYIPLRVAWQNDYPSRPLYYRVDGPNGGNLELKVDSSSGEVRGLVIIVLPPPRRSAWSPNDVPVERGLPVLDLAPWASDADQRISQNVVRSAEDLWSEWGPQGLVIRIGDHEVDRWIDAGSVAFGVARHGRLAALEISGEEGRRLRSAAGL
jgi:hypothetical protein